MRDENCIFCKIVAGEIPSRTLFEDEDFKVMLDVGPAAKGHALIIPKAHYADIYENSFNRSGNELVSFICSMLFNRFGTEVSQ